jgi:2'-5' RNA ligase
MEKLRLFFACWPDAGTAATLERWAQEASRATGGRVTRAQTIHLTLAFLGETPADRALDAIAAARRVDAPAHGFAIEQARYWPHNRIVWAGPKETPAPLAGLADGLRRELEAEGFRLEARPFAVHVTLIRRARPPKELRPPPRVDWPVREFVLVSSELSSEGSGYEVLERFRLRTEK